MPRSEPSVEDPRFSAALDLLGRAGAEEYQLRFDDDQDPVVFVAVIRHRGRWEAAGALHPVEATLRLCAQVIDGGTCLKCGRLTGFEVDHGPKLAENLICWRAWDPELRVFRRGCEGQAP